MGQAQIPVSSAPAVKLVRLPSRKLFFPSWSSSRIKKSRVAPQLAHRFSAMAFFPVLLLDVQLLFHVVQVDGQHPADPLLLHGDAVQHIRLLHGPAAVGDDNELGFIRHAPHIAGKAHHVAVVQRRLDLVHHHKGGGAHLQDGKIQRNGHERPLSAG